VAERQADVVEPFYQPPAGILVDLERSPDPRRARRARRAARALRPSCARPAAPCTGRNFATTAGLGFHAAGRYSLISPANLARSWIRAAGTGKAMTSGASSGAQGHAMALVAAAGVVVADVVGQDHAQVLLASDEHPVGALGPIVRAKRSAYSFILGAWGVIGSVLIPIDA